MRVLTVLIMAMLASCAHVEQNWYAETGPAFDFGDLADNTDVPWVIELGVKYKRCRIAYTHVSSVLAGRPFNPSKRDQYVLNAVRPVCAIGPGR